MTKWICKICGEELETSSELNRHEKTQHKKKAAKRNQKRGKGREVNLIDQWRIKAANA